MRLTSFEKEWQTRFSNVAAARAENYEMCFTTKGSHAGTVAYFFTYFSRHESGDNNNIRILDLGCGPGVVTRELGKRKFQVEGIDFSESMVEAARKATDLPNVKYQVGDVYDIPYPEMHFDVIVCMGVFQSVEDEGRALRAINNKLKPGGLLIVTTLNSYSLVHLVRKLLARTPSVHYLRYSPSAFARSLAQNGAFESIHVKGMYIFPGMLSGLTYFIQKLKIYVLLNYLWFLCKPLSHSFYIEARKKK